MLAEVAYMVEVAITEEGSGENKQILCCLYFAPCLAFFI